MTLVSVVIPVYNNERTISRSIESALTQSYENVEVIVVDDDSTDNSAKVASSYSEVNLVNNLVNKGGAASRNIGVDHANGKYIAFLDADDEWKPRKLELQINAMESSKAGAALCDFKLVRRKRLFFKNFFTNDSGEIYPPTVRNLLMKNFRPGGASSIIARAEVIEDINGFDEKFERHQDWEFLIRLIKKTHVCYVDEDLVVKYASGKPSAKAVERSKKKFLSKFENEIEQYVVDKDCFYNSHEFTLARLYFRELNFKEGVAHLCQSGISVQHILVVIYSVVVGILIFLRRVVRRSAMDDL